MSPKWSPACYFWGASAAFVIALILLVMSRGMFERQKILAEFTLQPDQHATAVTLPDPLRVPAGPLPLIYAEASVDQSWVDLECELLRPTGEVAAKFFINLAHYHGEKDGKPWTKGSPFISKSLPAPEAGQYLLRVKITAGDNPSGPPVHIRIYSGTTVRRMTWATTAFALTGFALLLRGFMPPWRPDPAEGLKSVEKPRFLFLDGLRGVAVLAVLICHFFVPELSLPTPYLEQALSKMFGSIARHGDLGVEIFFVLSGFVIAHSLGDHQVTPGFAARFIARRAVRLDPPYYVALGLMLMIVAVHRHQGLFEAWQEYGGWSAALSNLFYLQILLRESTPLDISWTLCLEIQFYLTLVALRMIPNFLPGRLTGPGMLLLFVLPLVLVSIGCWYPKMNRFDFLGTWFRFGLGVLTYLAFRGSIGRIWWALPMIVIVGLSVYFHDLRGLMAAGTAGLILFAGVTGRLATWLSNRPIQFIGKLSYSIYLIHLAAGVRVSNLLWESMEPTPAHALLVAVVGIATTIGAAMLVHRLFEKPGIAISHRLK